MNLHDNAVARRAVLIAAVMGLLTIVSFGCEDAHAQAQVNAAPHKPVPPVSVAPTHGPVAQSAPTAVVLASNAPIRTETVTYDAWTVTCRDTVDGKNKKVCAASLPMSVEQQNQRINLGGWFIGHNNDGALTLVVQTPEIDVGVMVRKGVDLKLGDGKPHRIDFVDCSPQRCEASLPIDDNFAREALAAANGSASITFWKADGAEFTINIKSIKGIDKALASLR